MNQFGKVAIEAVELARQGNTPLEAWENAVRRVIGDRKHAIKKSCPKSSFLGLASDGHIDGIIKGNYTKSKDNKRYAINALEILQAETHEISAKVLWERACESRSKAHSGQMDVVMALWCNGVLK